MLDLYKKEIERLSIDDLYFYSREFRIIYNDYQLLRRNFTVARLRFYGNEMALSTRFSIVRFTNRRYSRMKVYKKYKQVA